MILACMKLIIRIKYIGSAVKNNNERVFLMDKILEELTNNYDLSDYEALAVIGIIGILATTNINLKEVNEKVDNKLMPIVKSIATR